MCSSPRAHHLFAPGVSTQHFFTAAVKALLRPNHFSRVILLKICMGNERRGLHYTVHYILFSYFKKKKIFLFSYSLPAMGFKSSQPLTIALSLSIFNEDLFNLLWSPPGLPTHIPLVQYSSILPGKKESYKYIGVYVCINYKLFCPRMFVNNSHKIPEHTDVGCVVQKHYKGFDCPSLFWYCIIIII